MTAESRRKPTYRDRYPCPACQTGYLDCAALAAFGRKCCVDCDGHPGPRFTTKPAYTPAEMDDMRGKS